MTWKEINMVDQRKLFMSKVQEGSYSFAKLCRQFDISRPTGYKWLERFEQGGDAALENMSRSRHTQNNSTPVETENLILETKFKFSSWGPRKILAYLNLEYPSHNLPSKTTIGNILDRYGLIIPRKTRKRFAALTTPLSNCHQNNDKWCFDFKGKIETADGKKCEPFTLTDANSRYLFFCNHLDANDTEHVWSIFEIMFQEYGLPIAVLSDNGPPFASSAAGRLSRLSIRLIKAGVIPEHIDPGKPYQNGRHERMHLTLLNDAINLELSFNEQQEKLNEFKSYFNFVRPHEGIDNQRPGDIYCPSPRIWNGRLVSPEYEKGFKVARVRCCGNISWQGRNVYVGKILVNEPVGIKENDEGDFEVHYGPLFLGKIDDNRLDVKRLEGRVKNKYIKQEKIL